MEEIETMINKFADIAATIRDAEPELLTDTYGKPMSWLQAQTPG